VWFLTEGKKFHRRARAFLSRFDRDVHPRDERGGSAGAKVAVTMFSLTSPLPASGSLEPSSEGPSTAGGSTALREAPTGQKGNKRL
jgi:hypothetical protein